jgi:ribosome recycling factor
MTLDDILLDTEERMMKTIEAVEREFAAIHTGRASAALVENIQVECYGSMMRLRDIAGITTPESRVIAIQPWDVTNVQAIEKAIQKSTLGLSPRVDGKLLRIFLPQLSEERRKELAKSVRHIAEEGRVSVRNERRQGIDQIKKLQKDGKITEDDLATSEKEVQKLTDQYTAEIDRHLGGKEKEILTV